ncbi:MAG: hypothetical protein MR512_02205, partial [Anaerococcus sp.]|nr:hypothetical protein [Anaerococcus sp.]
YNPKSGKIESSDLREEKYASFRSVGLKEQNEIFGKVDTQTYSLVIKEVGKDYDYALVDDKEYKILGKEAFRNKTGYVVGEV